MRAMKRLALSPAQTPRLLLEAMRRRPRRGTGGAGRQTGIKGGTPLPIPHNNYLAERRASHGPAWGNRKGAGQPAEAAHAAKAGAPPGNSNAFKHGLASAESKARRAKVRAIVRHARQAIALAYAMAAAQIAANAASAEKWTTRPAPVVITGHRARIPCG